MLTKDKILKQLKTVIDPELDVNIVDLGLIYGVEITPSREGKLQTPRLPRSGTGGQANTKLQINSNTKNKNSKKIINNLFDVDIKMTLTSPGCPLSLVFEEWIREKVKKIKEVKNVYIELVWEPMWTIDMMSEEAKEKLGML
ncbi:MAG: metal-sulfur cluster assembly factor [bacterium]|nr:metal-sulfur cluster assembly factor [bacterium]